MVFSSLFFVYFFLALNLVIYFRTQTIRKKNIVMLVFSLIFYSWGGPRYLLLLVVNAAIAWICAIMIEEYEEFDKLFLVLDIVAQLMILAVFKYLGLFLGTVQAFTGVPEIIPEITLPIGISFYTFQLLSYVIDVYRGEVQAQRKFWIILLYASLFHQCIAGPIVRYQDIEHDIFNRKMKRKEMVQGIKRFTIGLAKKALLANGCAAVADTFLLTDDLQALAGVPAAGLWLGMLFFTLQIYLDFSAYSDMAIGMGLMIGFHYKENFNYPLMSDSVTDIWRRWHISLSTFFRDYVYIPLGGNRKGPRRQILNLFIVWFLTGLWHGASWNYVLWGLWFFVFLVLEKNFLLDILDGLPRFIPHIYALAVFYFGWVLFKFEDIHAIGLVFKGMLGLNGNGLTNLQVGLAFKNNIFFLIFAIIASTPLLRNLYLAAGRFFQRRKMVPYPIYVYNVISPIVLLVLATIALVGNSYNPFLYFQF